MSELRSRTVPSTVRVRQLVGRQIARVDCDALCRRRSGYGSKNTREDGKGESEHTEQIGLKVDEGSREEGESEGNWHDYSLAFADPCRSLYTRGEGKGGSDHRTLLGLE